MAPIAGSVLACVTFAALPQRTPDTRHIPAHFAFPTSTFNNTVCEAMIPMRDGARRCASALQNRNGQAQPEQWRMAQIQSSWFPRYAVNPQTYVENIFLAKANDYRLARDDSACAATTPLD